MPAAAKTDVCLRKVQQCEEPSAREAFVRRCLPGEYAIKIVEKKFIQDASCVDDGSLFAEWPFLCCRTCLAFEKEVQNRGNRVITERLMLAKMDHPKIATGPET